jgi:hypothetical protein
METANTSKMVANYYDTTRRNSPEDSHLHTRPPSQLLNLAYNVTQYFVRPSYSSGTEEFLPAKQEFLTQMALRATCLPLHVSKVFSLRHEGRNG